MIYLKNGYSTLCVKTMLKNYACMLAGIATQMQEEKVFLIGVVGPIMMAAVSLPARSSVCGSVVAVYSDSGWV